MIKKIKLYLISFLAMSVIYAFPALSDTSQLAIEIEVITDDTVPYMPGTDVDYEAIFRNMLGEAWIRACVDIECIGTDINLTGDDLNIDSSWAKHGDGYYYREEKAEAYTDYGIINDFHIPAMSKVDEGARITITITGQAIEYSSYDPDFTSDTPWDDAEITVETTTTTSSGSSKKSSSGGSSSSSSSGSSSSASLTIYSSPRSGASSSTGGWECISAEDKKWKFKSSDGTYAVNGWIYVYNPYSQDSTYYSWFHFDEDGMMGHGWIKASDTVWYYTHDVSDGNLGMMMTGWVDEAQDGKYYYMDLTTGIMLTGWQEIGGSEYYFATLDDIPGQTWFWETAIGQWIYDLLGMRSYGSLYINEPTPDGQKVDSNGVKITDISGGGTA